MDHWGRRWAGEQAQHVKIVHGLSSAVPEECLDTPAEHRSAHA